MDPSCWPRARPAAGRGLLSWEPGAGAARRLCSSCPWLPAGGGLASSVGVARLAEEACVATVDVGGVRVACESSAEGVRSKHSMSNRIERNAAACASRGASLAVVGFVPDVMCRRRLMWASLSLAFCFGFVCGGPAALTGRPCIDWPFMPSPPLPLAPCTAMRRATAQGLGVCVVNTTDTTDDRQII